FRPTLLVQSRGQIGPESLRILEADAETEEAGGHAVALPAGAALHHARHAAERRRVHDHARSRLHVPGRVAVGDVEGEEAAEAGPAHGLDGWMVAEALD